MKKLISFFESHKKLTIFLAICWTIIIFIGCSLPGKELPKINLFDHFDKVVHLSFFALFFALWFLITNKSIKYALLIILISFCYGFGIEFYQMNYVAGRSFDIWDGVADGMGAIFSYTLLRYLRK